MRKGACRMRTVLVLAALAPLPALAGCDQFFRDVSITECTDFYRYSRDGQIGSDGIRAACGCAVDREAAGRTPVAGVPDRPDPALGEFRRHLPDCLAEHGGSATGVAARESSGAAPLPATFDPATGWSADPPGQVMPGPGDIAGEAPPPEEPPPSMSDGPPPPVVQAPLPPSANVPRAAPDTAIVRNRAGRPLQCGPPDGRLGTVDAGGDYDVRPGPVRCAPPVRPELFDVLPGRTYDFVPEAGVVTVRDVTPAR